MRSALIILIAGCGFKSPAGAIDATSADLDAAGFDFAQCPASYNVALPGPSRYRLIATGHRAWEQSDACKQDLPGATHLAVIEIDKELADIKTFISNPGVGIASDGLYLGGVQLRTATSPSDGWLGFDGVPLINGWGGGEPNDGGGGEGNHEEQFVEMARTALYFIDVGGNESFGALCECDGKPVAATVAAAVDGYRR